MRPRTFFPSWRGRGVGVCLVAAPGLPDRGPGEVVGRRSESPIVAWCFQLRRHISLTRFHKVDSVAYCCHCVESVLFGRHCATGTNERRSVRATMSWSVRAQIILVTHARMMEGVEAMSDDA
jgi:hypothetical protein